MSAKTAAATETLDREIHGQAALLSSEDAREGRDAFLQKRTTTFVGR